MATSTSKRGKKAPRPVLLRAVYKSKLEDNLAEQLETEGVDFEYESLKVPYQVPARDSEYIPDFILKGSNIIIEGKGRFGHRSNQKAATQERQKMILVKQQHPDLDIRIVFDNPELPIYKGSKTTYAKWADTHGFPWAAKRVPDEWLKEAKEHGKSKRNRRS